MEGDLNMKVYNNQTFSKNKYLIQLRIKKKNKTGNEI